MAARTAFHRATGYRAAPMLSLFYNQWHPASSTDREQIYQVRTAFALFSTNRPPRHRTIRRPTTNLSLHTFATSSKFHSWPPQIVCLKSWMACFESTLAHILHTDFDADKGSFIRNTIRD